MSEARNCPRLCSDVVCITFDADWVPDWCLEDCYELCKSAGIGATFFLTNESPSLARIALDKNFEVGIHPNFLPGSSHGDSIPEVLDSCFTILRKYTDDAAIALRSHCLWQHSVLYAELTRRKEIFTDISTFIYLADHLKPFLVWYDASHPPLCQVPYFWEDDIAACTPGWEWNMKPALLDRSGIKVFNFHPIHVALNMDSMNRYKMLKKHCQIPSVTRKKMTPFENTTTRGTRSFLVELLASMRQQKEHSATVGLTISTVGAISREYYAHCGYW